MAQGGAGYPGGSSGFGGQRGGYQGGADQRNNFTPQMGAMGFRPPSMSPAATPGADWQNNYGASSPDWARPFGDSSPTYSGGSIDNTGRDQYGMTSSDPSRSDAPAPYAAPNRDPYAANPYASPGAYDPTSGMQPPPGYDQNARPAYDQSAQAPAPYEDPRSAGIPGAYDQQPANRNPTFQPPIQDPGWQTGGPDPRGPWQTGGPDPRQDDPYAKGPAAFTNRMPAMGARRF